MTPLPATVPHPKKHTPAPGNGEIRPWGRGFFHGIRGKKFPFPIDKTVSTVYTVNIQF